MASDLQEQLTSHRDYYGAYHHHKEQMAFSAAALYLAGTAALVLQDKPAWCVVAPVWALYMALGVSTVVAFVFVAWQFALRGDAEKIVRHCNKLLAADLLNQEASVPATEVEQLKALLTRRPWWARTVYPVLLAYGVIIAWAALGVLRIFAG